MMPLRVIEIPHRISMAEAERIHTELKRRGLGDVLVLDNGATMKTLDAMPTPDAICPHCGRANLGTSYQCLGCNAPLVRAEAK